MKILMLTVNSSLLDGVNRHILMVAPALNARDGIEVAVCTTHPAGELNDELEAKGVKTYSLNAPHGHSFKIFWRFTRILREFAPDIVHAHVVPFFVKVIFSRGIKVGFIETKHGICVSKYGTPTKGLKSVLWRKVTGVVARQFVIRDAVRCYIAKEAKADFERYGEKYPSYVIYNPMVRCERKTRQGELQRRIGVPKSTRIIGSACRFAAVKDPESLARVMCMVMKCLRDVHAAILGDGASEWSALMRRVAVEFGVSDRLYLPGYCKDAAELVRDMSFFVMTSHEEGMPTSLLEAMAGETPVAFLKGGGGLIDLSEMNSGNAAFAVMSEAGDVGGLACRIVELMRNPAALGGLVENAKKLIDDVFALDKICSQMEVMYKEVLCRK